MQPLIDMAAEKSPAFQFYARDWLSSDSVSLMTAEQAGAYITLLAHAWLKPEGLPSDLPSLSKLARVPALRFERAIWPRLSGCFRVNDAGNFFNPRLETERATQERHRTERSQSGKRGAATRWASKRDGSVNGSAIKEPMAKNGSSSATTSAIHTGRTPLTARRALHVLNEGDTVPFPSALVSEFQPIIAAKSGGDGYTALLAWTHRVSDAALERLGGCPREAIGKGAFDWWRQRLAEDFGAESRPVVRACRYGHKPPCHDDATCTARYLDETQRGVAHG